MKNKRWGNLALSSNGFLFDAKTGCTYTLNKTGTFILKCLIEGASSSDLVEKLTENFDVPAAVATRALDEFPIRLYGLKLLPEPTRRNGSGI